VNSPGSALEAPALAALATAAAEIVDLNLAAADLDDAELAALGALPAVTHLRLARNRLSDSSVAALARNAPQLTYLNLYGNAGVTDRSVEALGRIATLRKLYVWRTAVSAAGAARLRALRPNVMVDVGSLEALADANASP
jgi:hypothetical protein